VIELITILLETNGCQGSKTIKVETGASYESSFWIKGDIEKVASVSLRGGRTERTKA
jgi:hypothetical protein